MSFKINILLPIYICRILRLKVHQSPERAKRTVHPPHRRPRKEQKAAALPLPVLRKAPELAPSLPRHQGKAHGLDPRDQDQDRKELSLRVRKGNQG